MRINLFLTLAIGAILLLSGCETLYGPALAGSNLPYQASSAYHGEDVTETWVSGSFHQGIIYGGAQESNFLAQGSIHRSHTSQNFKATYGAFGYGGTYNIPNTGDMNFFGLGLRGSLSVLLPTDKIDFNLIGFQGGLNGEFGEYNQFRKGRDLYLGEVFPTSNIISGIDIKGQNSSFGLQAGLGFNGIPVTLNFINSRINVWAQANLLTFDGEYNGNSIWSMGAGFRL